jgi:hypothetical protein
MGRLVIGKIKAEQRSRDNLRNQSRLNNNQL